jgi:hypothetical protein
MPGRGEGFTPRQEPLGPASGWWVSAPPHSLPGRSRDGSAPIGPGILLVRGGGHLRHTFLQGLRASTLEDIRPVAALGGTVRTVLDYPRSFFLERKGFPVPSFLSPSLPVSVPAPPHHRRGTPARRAMLPGMPIPRLDPEAGLARGYGGEGERVRNCQKLPVIVKCPESRLPPCRGILRPPLSGNGKCSRRAAALRATCWRRGNPLFPLHMERSAVSPAYPVGRRDPHGCPCRDSSGPSHHPCRDGAGTPAGRHTERPGSL